MVDLEHKQTSDFTRPLNSPGALLNAKLGVTRSSDWFVSLAEMAALYVSPHLDDFRSLLALVAAEYTPSPRPSTVTEEPPASLSSCSRPTLVLGPREGGSVLSGATAVSWYLAFQGKKAGGNAKQQSQVWQWLSFADNELTPVSCAVVFPLMGMAGLDKKVKSPLRFCVQSFRLRRLDCWCRSQIQQNSRAEMMRVLKVLDQALEPRTFLVGESITLADMAVVMAVLLPFKYVRNNILLFSL